MDIHDCGQPIFDWYHWYDIDSASDGGIVEISTNDGITWTQVTPELGYPCSALEPGSALSGQPAFTGNTGDSWEYQSVDLTPWVSFGEIWLRFRFASDASGEAPGWYIDDIGLTEAFGVITGHVDLGYRTDESGALVQIAELELSDISDVSGYYFLDRVKVGTWNVSCTRDSFAGQVEIGVAVARDETVTVDFYLPPTLMATNRLECRLKCSLPYTYDHQFRYERCRRCIRSTGRMAMGKARLDDSSTRSGFRPWGHR